MEDKKAHWENIFSTKSEKELSWFQENPETSIKFVKELDLPKNAKIIDIGGGDSHFIDTLLDLGFTNLYLLDISAKAIARIKKRLGKKSENVNFIVSDILDFDSEITFDFWHDRASFHFLITENEIKKYSEIVSKSVVKGGKMIMSTFSENGPKKCSNLAITPYSETKMNAVFEDDFDTINCFTEDHKTPFDTIQNFIFCSFNKK